MKRRYRWPLWSLAAIVLLLVTLHIALPYLVRDYLNDKLADMGDYRGQITDVDLAWWRGAYRINGLQIVKVQGKVPVPFLKAPLIDLAVSWHSLWYDHAVVAKVQFVQPELNFVDGGADKQSFHETFPRSPHSGRLGGEPSPDRGGVALKKVHDSDAASRLSAGIRVRYVDARRADARSGR